MSWLSLDYDNYNAFFWLLVPLLLGTMSLTGRQLLVLPVSPQCTKQHWEHGTSGTPPFFPFLLPVSRARTG